MIERIGVVPDKCIACHRCEVACIASHHDLTFKDAMKAKNLFLPRVHVIKMEGLKTTVRCHQCDPAPCCNVCPTGALHQAEDGRISLYPENCVACGMCVRVCPYGEIELDARDVEEKRDASLPASCVYPKREAPVRCDLCYSWRMDNGKNITACMEACPVKCLYLRQPDGSIVEAPKQEKEAKSAKAEAKPEQLAS